MTRPRWMRKREELLNRLDYIARVSYHRGRIEFIVEGNEHIISLKKGEESDDEKWAIFFQSVKNVIIRAYRSIAFDETNRETKKYLLYDSTDTILADIFLQIERAWRKEGRPVIIDPEEVKLIK